MSKARDLANAGTALTTVSPTELGYLDGVTSAVQTQIDAKQATVSGVDDTEIGYLDGVTSAIQTQIDSKIGQSTAINPSIVDAKGDIIAATADNTPARLAVGTNGQVLTAASGQATGLQWVTPAASGSMTSLASGTLSGTFDLTSIPAGYKNIVLKIWNAQRTSAGEFSATFNSSGGTPFSYGRYTLQTTPVLSGASGVSSVPIGYVNASPNTLTMELTIYDYTSTTSNKMFTAFSMNSLAGAGFNLTGRYFFGSSPVAITSIQLPGTFTGGNYELFGVK